MNKRDLLATIAKEEAQRCFHGNVMNLKSNLKPITDLFSFDVDELDGYWCAAFVYYCCVKAGFDIPARYLHKDNKIVFVGCLDWEEWSKLPQNQFYYKKDDENFTPTKGDIVLYNNVFCNEEHDHIGIIVEKREDSFVVAEGNINNVSGLVVRNIDDHIRGYIRIPQNYSTEES